MKDFLLTDKNKFFWLSNNRSIKSINELLIAINKMNDDEFKKYVNKNKNDFSTWIRYSFHNSPLSMKLSKVFDREETKKILFHELLQANNKKIKNEAKSSIRKDIKKLQEDRELSKKQVEIDKEEKEKISFENFRKKETENNERLSDKFDKKNQELTELNYYETPDVIDMRFSSLLEYLNNLKQEVSEARKEGHDSFFLDLMLRPLLSKLNYAKSAEDIELFNKIEKELNDCKSELEEVVSKKPVDVKKEVEKLTNNLLIDNTKNILS